VQRQSTIQRWCDYVIEAGWLLALSLIPIYFNLLSSRHFEPDKATTLRALVLVMLAAWLIRALDGLNSRPPAPEPPPADAAQVPVNPFGGLWRRLRAFPLALPALAYALVFLVATVFSVVPGISFWGSYQRGQGAYTNLSYVALFALICATLRTRAQFDRLVTVLLLASLPVSGYGLIQHFQLDPLPWKGDVISRVASTMGNSIFVAAYLIMVLPFALYRLLTNLAAARSAPREGGSGDALWGVAYALLVAGTLALLLSVIKFGAVVRVPEPTFRYWWVFPGAIAICTALWALVARGLANAERVPRAVFVTGGLTLGFLIVFGIQFLLSQATGQQFDSRQVRGMDWGLWMLGGVVALGAFFALAYLLPRRAGLPSRALLLVSALGNAVVALAALVAIFFTQSRGPWIGGAAGVFVFFTLVLWRAARHASAQGSGVAGRLRAALAGWVVLALAVGGFLLAFNLSNAPVFDQLRTVPYIGRMGRLLETDTGTGLVRRLIWFGDEHGGGAVGLITADPLRAIVGWGPESMFVAYNPFYPPSLANIEARGASPDRSHQAILDELVTKGVLGLLSYLFLLISFGLLCWRLILLSETWHWQVFFIACLSAVVANVVEGLTGIPIVSTLMMLWLVLGATVVGGQLAGVYSLQPQREQPAPAAQPAPAPALKGRGQGQRARGAVARGAASARASTSRRQQTSPAALGLYSLLLVLTLGAVWWFNLNPVYADMRFQEAQAYSDNPQAGLREEVVGLDKYLDTIRRDPDEDFYYLNLGRTLMNTADLLRAQGAPLGEAQADASVAELLRLADIEDISQFVTSKSPLALMSYAEAVLMRARDLNPLNKDHYANLARLNSFWYSWTSDPQRITQATKWYEQAANVAPNDMAIANERASAVALLGTYTEKQGDAAGAKALYAQAEQILARSKAIDPRFTDTNGRLAEVYRLQGKLAEATPLYTATLAVNPHQFDPNIEALATSYQSQPELFKQIQQAYLAAAAARPTDANLQAIAGLMSVRAGDLEGAVKVYAAAVAAAPGRLDFLRNYTLVLSDTRRYPEALAQAQQGLSVLEQQGEQADQQELATFQYLVGLLQQMAAGGQ
jgi:tetratricopeptide (TPR) repeat protein